MLFNHQIDASLTVLNSVISLWTVFEKVDRIIFHTNFKKNAIVMHDMST